MTRRIFGVLIVAGWVGMVGWQVRREYFQPELARLSEATLSLAPGVSFYTLKMGDRLVGQATSRLDTVPGGFVLEDVMSLELPALGQTGTAVARTSVRLSQALEMQSFSFSLDSQVGTFLATGVVRADTTLAVTIDSGSGPQEVEYKLASPPVFSAIVPIRVAMGGDLEVGNTVRLPVFDPSTMGIRTVELHVIEQDTIIVPDSVRLDPTTNRWSAFHYDSVPVWKVAEVYGGVSVESWVDADGRVLRASSPLGFSMEKTEFELALQERDDMRRALAAGEIGGALDDDVILSTAVQSNVDLGDATRFSEVRFRLTGVDLSGFQLDGGRQTLRGDTLIVRREDWDAIVPGYDLPYKTMDMAEYLAPEPLIQSDDPRIISRARSVTAARADWSLDPKQVAGQLTRSVFASLDKEITISVPSAVQVLESGRGDCNEHTVLFVALARALGLPARTAVGLVWVNGAFFYHAWPEVWMGGDWVAMVPAETSGGLEKSRDIRMAAFALLLELAYADRDFSKDERTHLRAAIQRHYGLDQREADDLIALAEEERAQAVDLWQFTRLINANYSPGQKMVLAEVMWGLVYADGTLGDREDILIRKITDLLGLKPAAT